MSTAVILIVEHATDQPAVDAMAAGALAGVLKAAGVADIGFARLRSPNRDFAQLGAREHATASGELVANGLTWAERALGRDLVPNSECTAAELRLGRPSVISVNPNLVEQPDIDAVLDLETSMRVQVNSHGTSFVLTTETDGMPREIGGFRRDRYGRPLLDLHDAAAFLAHFHHSEPKVHAPKASSAADGPAIVVVAEEAYHRDVYPELLAALGDAADALGQAPAIRFVSPRGRVPADWLESFADADGVLLPGGPDTTQTAGQVDAAAATLDSDVPTLGICLGMQTMTTAFARLRAGLPGAGLEEIDALARPQTFVRMRSPDGEGRHRLGAKRLKLAAGSRLAGLLDAETATERLHHRYHLSPGLVPVLAGAGLLIAARDSAEPITDAIEVPQHPFFMGLQYHIELSRRGRLNPHPVLTAFLRAAAARAQIGIHTSAPCSSPTKDRQ